MRWQMGRRSTNVEDRRGRLGGGGLVGLGGGGILIVVVIALLTGKNPIELLQQVVPNSETVEPAGEPGRFSEREQQLADFSSVVLADTEDTWGELFQRMGRVYQPPRLVLFTGAVESACGFAESAVGPFYCPEDARVYLDLSFFDDLRTRFGAPGDFAQAYVIAHEVGHHVQDLLGTMDKVRAMRDGVSEEESNRLSVRLELQADFYAGIWAHYAQQERQVLEEGDLEEALNAAAQIGDDRLQRESQGYVVPDAFTHGTSAQRVRWFRLGFRTGDLEAGDTFTVEGL
jgi:predicted metalloprotease